MMLNKIKLPALNYFYYYVFFLIHFYNNVSNDLIEFLNEYDRFLGCFYFDKWTKKWHTNPDQILRVSSGCSN